MRRRRPSSSTRSLHCGSVSSAHSRNVPPTTMTWRIDDDPATSGGARRRERGGHAPHPPTPPLANVASCADQDAARTDCRSGIRGDRGRRLHVACIMDGNGRWAEAARPPADRRPHRGRGEPGPPRAGRRPARHRLADGVRLLDRELGPPAGRGPPHPRPAREAVRAGRRAQRAERADPVDRPAVRLAPRRGPRSTCSGRSARRSPTPPATPAWC